MDIQPHEISQGLSAILTELKKQKSMTDDLWAADEIADYMKLSKKSVQNKVLDEPTFPKSIPLPTGGRRWLAKEIRKWVEKRRG